MKRIGYVLLLLFTFTLMELHNLVPAPLVQSATVVNDTVCTKPTVKKVSLFMNSRKEQTVAWYVHDTAQLLVWIIVLLIVILVRDTYEIRKLLIIHLVYRVLDLFMYWYDFRQSHTPYIVFYIVITIFAVVDLIFDLDFKRKQ